MLWFSLSWVSAPHESCSSSRKIQCDWVDTQNQNKRLNNRYCEMSLRTIEAATTIPIHNTMTVIVLAFCFEFGYRANRIVSYESCYMTASHRDILVALSPVDIIFQEK